MALTLTEISAYTNTYIVPKSTDTIFKNSPVLTRLQQKNMERFAGGLQIQRPIIVGELNGDAIGRGEAMNIDFVTTDSALVENMKLYYVNISLFGFDSIANDGPEAIFSQVEAKFANASLKMAKLLGVNMYLEGQSPARAKHINGLQEWYDDGVLFPTIGGITRSDVQAVGTVGGLNAYTATLGSFTLGALNTAYGNAWFGADHPDLIAATQNGWNFIWSALQPLQRYMPVQDSSDLGKAGFQVLQFNGADVVIDKYMPTGTNGVMYGLNTDYIEWYYSTNPKFQYGFTGFKEVNATIDVAGQFLVANNMLIPNPRTGFKLLSTLF